MKAKYWFSVRGREGRLSWAALKKLWDRFGKLKARRKEKRHGGQEEARDVPR